MSFLNKNVTFDAFINISCFEILCGDSMEIFLRDVDLFDGFLIWSFDVLITLHLILDMPHLLYALSCSYYYRIVARIISTMLEST